MDATLLSLPALRRRGRRVRSALLARRRLLAMLLTAVAVAAALRVVSPPEPASEPVLAAADDLPAGHRIADDDLVEVALPPDAVPSGAARRDQAVGRLLASPLRRGEAVTDVRLLSPSLLAGHPGLVAVPVRIPDGSSVDLVRVGDRLDLISADPAGSGPARTIAVRAPVLAIPPPGGDGGAPTGLGGRLVVLGLSAEAGRQVAAESVRGVLMITLSG